MDTVAKREYLVLGILVVIFLVWLYPSLLHARREHRDGIRRNEITTFKQLLEEKNNELGYYPTEFNAAPHVYIVTEAEGEQAVAWYLRAELENKAEPTVGFDLEHNVYFRVSNEGEKTFYDVCGGTSTCGAPLREE